MSYTNIVFQHPGFQVTKTDGYASCIAASKISQGDVLLVEHALVSTDIVKIVNIVTQNSDIYLTLCPHERDGESRNPDVATKKVASNMFRADDLFALGARVSMMNHSCSPNAMVTYTHVRGYSIPISLIVVYAVRDIEENEEICIMYGPKVGHEQNSYHDFECHCAKSDEERIEVFESFKTIRADAASSPDNIYGVHLSFVRDYLSRFADSPAESDGAVIPADSSHVEEIVTLHHLAMDAGIYKATPTQLVPTARFEEYIKEHFGVERTAPDSEKFEALTATMAKMEDKCKEFLKGVTV